MRSDSYLSKTGYIAPMLRGFVISCLSLLLLTACNESLKKKDKDSIQNRKNTETRTIEDIHGNKIECLVDINNITQKNTIKNSPDFNEVKWDNETKEAWVSLKNGDSLYVHVTGCRDFYVQVRLIRYNNTEEFSNVEYWFEQAMWIAEHVRGFDPEHLQEIHDEKKFTSEQDEDGIAMDFNEHDYDLYVDRSGKGTLIMLVHHFQ